MSFASRSLAAALSVGLTLLPSMAAAQPRPSNPISGRLTQAAETTSTPKFDIFAGVGIWREEGHALRGLHLSGAIRASRHVAFVGDVGFYDAGEVAFFPPRSTVTTVMGGVRVFGTMPRATLFGQLLAGRAPFDDFALQPGVGLDVHLTRRAAIRVAGDVKISGDDGSTYLGGRFSTGVVFLLGGQ